MANIKIQTLTCVKCKHTWTPRQPVIKMCPSCKTTHWQKPKEHKTKPIKKED